MDYLERGLEGEIEYRRAAAEANCSTFHFLRMFEVVTGVTVGEYVRRRRLSRAALELSEGEARVTDLALRFGYESPDAFAKAFKREFGITPSQTRGGGVRLQIWPRMSFSVVLKGDVAMEFRIEKREEFAVTGVTIRASTENGANLREIPGFWDKCTSEGQVKSLERAIPANARMGVMGICVNDFDDKTNTFTYLIGIERPADAAAREALPRGCVDVAVPAGTWAVFSSRGPLPGAIQQVWKRVYTEWFPASGYEHASSPDLEVYSIGDTRAADYYCEVWLPVRKT
ncbi:MAG TPA: AraC family transcriptional regulator [Spirochaetia bacterium]|nr:AraC family transcriptional regulator [Spirochaetia bacterium]